MTAIDLLRELRALGIKVRVDEDQLAVKAPAGALTPELAARLRDHKAEILAFLRDAESAPAAETAVESLKGLADPANPPISPDQRKEWHLQRLDPGSPVYNAAGAFRLRGPLDRSALQGALQTMVDRHSVLRSRFVERDREPVLVIDDDVRVEISEQDLSGIREAEREDAMRAFLEEAADEILDLEKGPPFRARLARLGPEDHAFFFLAHSILWDGWSFDLLLKEMTTHYEAHLEGRRDALPPLPIQYIDFAAWQNLRQERGDFRPHLEFWRKQLKGPIPPLRLPSDRPRRPESDYLGARVWSKIEKGTLDGLRVLTRSEGATLYMVLLAALDVLLHRYTGARDIVVSSPLQGRTHPELEDLIGAFTNTLFFRTAIDPDESFRSLLRRVKDTCLEAVDHQEAPADQVIKLMDEQGLGRTPYEVIFVFQQAADRPTTMGPVSVRSIPRGTRVVPVDLMMWAREYDDYLDGGVDYRTSLFDDARMQRLISHYQRLLDSIGRDPDVPVKELLFLGDDEVSQLQEWGEAQPRKVDVPGEGVGLGATVGGGAQVKSGANGSSEEEIRAGIGKMKELIGGTLPDRQGETAPAGFALAFDGSLESLLALEAAREMSTALVLFHPEARAPEISRRMSDLGVRHLLVGPDSSLLASEGLENVTRLDLSAETGSGTPELPRNPGGGGIFFGGGGPGVEDAAERLLAWESIEGEISGLMRHLGLDSNSGVALYLDGPPEQWVPVALATLTAGGTLFLPEPGQPPDGWELDELVEKGEITVLVGGSWAAQELVDTGWEARVGRTLLGDPFAPGPVLESTSSRSGVVEIGWGMPAVGGWALIGKVEGAEAPPERRLRRTPWAPPVAILDSSLQRLPQGIPGEIWLQAGGKPGADIPPEARGRPTGQMARWAGDGSLMLEGRKDRWGNLNGHHVDLAEVEAELQDLEVIREAYLQATVQAGRRRLVAHIVPVQEDGTDDESLRSSVGGQGALVTRHLSFAHQPDLPRTLSGLVDERALALRLEHASRDRSETEPQTPEEKALAEIWKEVLGLPDVGVQDKFFDLGGHSLLAVQVTLRLEEEKGLRIDPRTLFFESLGQVAAGAIPLSVKPSPGG